jgi:hypothetical protein
MVYHVLKEVAEGYRLSFEVDEDREIELLKETWQCGSFDFDSSIGLTEPEYRVVRASVAGLPRSDRATIKTEIVTADRKVCLVADAIVVDLSCYHLWGADPEFNGDFAVGVGIWDEIAPRISEALAGGEG